MTERDRLRAYYQGLAEASDRVLKTVAEVETGRGARRGGIQSRRIRSRLERQQEVLRRLQSGEMETEEALVLLLEEEARPAAPSGAVGGYLSRMSGDLRRITAARGGLPVEEEEGPAEDEPLPGGIDD